MRLRRVRLQPGRLLELLSGLWIAPETAEKRAVVHPSIVQIRIQPQSVFVLLSSFCVLSKSGQDGSVVISHSGVLSVDAYGLFKFSPGFLKIAATHIEPCFNGGICFDF